MAANDNIFVRKDSERNIYPISLEFTFSKTVLINQPCYKHESYFMPDESKQDILEELARAR
jgi:hypothetical protein